MKTEIIKVHPDLPDNNNKIVYCANVIRHGGLVIFPTETVYGIAADYSNKEAVNKLYEVKKRSHEKPFSVLISQKELISNYTRSTSSSLYKLINEFWPGPLTVVVRSREEGKTIGIRMPDNIVALSLVREARCTLAAPSANLEDCPPPSTCEEALKDLDGLVDVALDGGPSRIGQGSTVLDLTQENMNILREGSITKLQIENVLKRKTIIFICTGNSCRSVMADYLMKDMVKDRSDVDVYSAGTGVFLHSTASQETISVLREKGIDASSHMSMPLDSSLLRQADLIFVMTRGHRAQVLERVPEVETKVYLLKEFYDDGNGLQSNLDIPDPMGGSHDMYKECLDVIEACVRKVSKLI
ncbi:MAG: threonylcarbamoyl-AMP synthase [Omnitrophica WOR_2 bacterium GWF2_38_59]|nr:MAG: threonylcarbamoyl-AMP synthase [Omnitrophica WOR_2 bacterium GWF2_38_59]OGX48555.1 MAG: threonylcarbamoyl-AMP synthase [Omnitrophica WOR_2 bacterium RIFOXYA2_FULL_38_17]OGX58956.1 MAG: threonylcarbamoyl-AMP synthase [Omnitrophica WOR_2 bacterium RIFOXYC2_FULL_38_12]OGX59327.1 MAG: threonylcarbamoyl-AMP synthase [Omnitrophica WOR_2 bacterium RIFOXYB2_FULL_38_16]HBG62331.1 threonylcarbamoyl-AMP synthase [Candidatus Omnitrophota bacterium]